MIFGKVAMLALAKKKMKNTSFSDKRKQIWNEFKTETQSTIKKSSHLIYQRSPVALWSLGGFFIVLGIFLIWIILSEESFIPEIDELSFSSKMMISLTTSLIGVVMIFMARVEKLKINRNNDCLILERKNLFGCKDTLVKYLHKLTNLDIVKKGMLSFHENSIYYILRIQFQEEEDLEVSETRDFDDIKRKYIQICFYLGRTVPKELDKIKFIDESIVTLEWKKKKSKEELAKIKKENSKNKFKSTLNTKKLKRYEEEGTKSSESLLALN